MSISLIIVSLCCFAISVYCFMSLFNSHFKYSDQIDAEQARKIADDCNHTAKRIEKEVYRDIRLASSRGKYSTKSFFDVEIDINYDELIAKLKKDKFNAKWYFSPDAHGYVIEVWWNKQNEKR